MLALSLFGVPALGAPALGASPSRAPQAGVGEVEFERDVRPLLEASCFPCHGPHARRIRGGLMMSSREALLRGGDRGSAIAPGDSDGSLLIQLVRHEHESLEMPPEAVDRLTTAQVAVLERWVDRGAPWPEGAEVPSDRRDIDLEAGRAWWSFRPVTRPALPQAPPEGFPRRARNAIDRFVYARLAQEGLPAAPQADDRTLVRRLYIDLLGLPPTSAELETYLADARPDRYARLVDELLARPQFGERWGRYWLDVVRFAQTNGYEADSEKPYVWRYRDYVVDSFNADKPYDQFLREQLAGDELEELTDEGLVATGFYQLGVWDSEANDEEQARFDGYDDVLRTIGEGLLGVTIGCARCHDHRTDPIRQRDYFAMLAFLRNVEPYAAPSFHPESRTHRTLGGTPSEGESWDARRLARIEELQLQHRALIERHMADYVEANFARLSEPDPGRAARALLQEETSEAVALALGVDREHVRQWLPVQARLRLFRLEAELEGLERSFEGEFAWALTVFEAGPEAPPTFVHHRGRAASEVEEVRPAFLPVLCDDEQASAPDITVPLATSTARASSGRRRALARWITDPAHPTTARVLVNRLWQGLFGRGIVATPNDLGATGAPPTHPELLDWLAAELVDGGWRVKPVLRLLLNSAVYRAASRFESVEARERDRENELLWRQNMRRLDAEALHDGLLAVSGLLELERGGRGFFPHLSREALASSSRPGRGWEVSSPEERNRRAIYAFVKRGLLVPFLTVFDSPDPNNPRGRRSSTTVASQALTLLNGELAGRSAQALARELVDECGLDRARAVDRLYRRVLLREPTPGERDLATAFLERQAKGFAALSPRSTFRAAMPRRVDEDYMPHLAAEDYLFGPREGWAYYVGSWGNPYNMTQEALPDRGPFALLEALPIRSGRLSFELTLDEGCTRAAVLLKAWAEGGGVARHGARPGRRGAGTPAPGARLRRGRDARGGRGELRHRVRIASALRRRVPWARPAGLERGGDRARGARRRPDPARGPLRGPRRG